MNRCAPVANLGIVLWPCCRWPRAVTSESLWSVKPDAARNSFPLAKCLSDDESHWDLS